MTFIFPLVALLTASPIGKCDPVGGAPLEWSAEQRKQTRRIVRDSLRARGASRKFLAYADAVIVRESSGAASRWHDGGRGLGPAGINHATHARRWPRPLVPALCDPVVSAAILQDIVADVITRHGAANAWEIQAGYAGRFECIGEGHPTKVCTAEQQDRTTAAICSRIEARGVGCYEPITLADVGRRMTRAERLAHR